MTFSSLVLILLLSLKELVYISPCSIYCHLSSLHSGPLQTRLQLIFQSGSLHPVVLFVKFTLYTSTKTMVLNQHVQVTGFKIFQLLPMTPGKSVNISHGYSRSLIISLHPIFYYHSPFLTLQLNHPLSSVFGLRHAASCLYSFTHMTPPPKNPFPFSFPPIQILVLLQDLTQFFSHEAFLTIKFPFLSPSLCQWMCVFRGPLGISETLSGGPWGHNHFYNTKMLSVFLTVLTSAVTVQKQWWVELPVS